MTLISGEWLLTDFDNGESGYDIAYEGTITGSWSGGYEWVTSLQVAQEIVKAQDELRAGDPDSYDRITVDETTGNITLHSSADGETYTYEGNVTADGKVECNIGFGWTWYPLDETDHVKRVVTK